MQRAEAAGAHAGQQHRAVAIHQAAQTVLLDGLRRLDRARTAVAVSDNVSLRAADDTIALTNLELERLDLAMDNVIEHWEGMLKRLRARQETLSLAGALHRVCTTQRRLPGPRIPPQIVKTAPVDDHDAVARAFRDVLIESFGMYNGLHHKMPQALDLSWIDEADLATEDDLLAEPVSGDDAAMPVEGGELLAADSAMPEMLDDMDMPQ